MADSMNVSNQGAGKIDLTKWKKLTAQEIISEEGKGEEVPAEILAWAQQMAAFSKIPDNVTYDKVDGDTGIEALEKLGLPIEEPAEIEEENAIETDTNVSPLIIAPIFPPHLCFAIVSNTGLNTPDLDIFSSVFVTVLEFAILL